MPEAGPVGRQVAASVDQLREARGWSWRKMSAEVEQLGRPILPLGFTRMMRGDRRTDVDELVALAVALRVDPNALLFNRRAERDDMIELTPGYSQRADLVWNWAAGREPLPSAAVNPGENPTWNAAEWHDFAQHARPDMDALRSHPAVAAAEQLASQILGALNRPDDGRQEDRIRRALQRAQIEVEEMFADADAEGD